MTTETLNPEIFSTIEEEIITPTKVILFNDEIHSFDEVVSQIIKAIKCNSHKAEKLAYKAHNDGKTIVYGGDLVKCIEVSSILEEIKLITQIEV